MLVDTDSAITIIRADVWEKVSVYCKHSGSNYTSSGGSKWKGYGQVVLNIHGGGGGGGVACGPAFSCCNGSDTRMPSGN